MAGRGFGKTRCAGEWIRSRVDSGVGKRIALVGRTAADVRDVMIEGESGLLAISPPWNRPVYEPSKRRLTWPNGAMATAYSADAPDLLRGPQHDTGWCDEVAAWEYPEAFDQLRFGMRLGDDPRIVASTTPRPTDLIRTLAKDPTTRVTRGGTYENAGNLAQAFIDEVRRKYEGTRLGRQELFGEILEDTPGALWTHGLIDANRAREMPELRRIVVGVDPAVTSTETADETGIVVAGLGHDGKGYILRDATMKGSPDEWARRVVSLYDEYGANGVVAEVNNGGELVGRIVRSAAQSLAAQKKRPNGLIVYKDVRAAKAKRARAEPVAALYEQGRVKHVGSFAKLEDQMCTWDASDGSKSPDRIDALVWAISELIVDAARPARGELDESLLAF